jgi:hypothetical protein
VDVWKPKRGESVITVREPWATAIIHLGKTIENRPWRTKYRGRIWIHTSKGAPGLSDNLSLLPRMMKRAGERNIDHRIASHDFNINRGKIVGSVEIVDCVGVQQVRRSPSLKRHRSWAIGLQCFLLENPIPLRTPVPAKGALGIWKLK